MLAPFDWKVNCKSKNSVLKLFLLFTFVPPTMSAALPSERTALLENGSHSNGQPKPPARSFVDVLKATDEPSWLKSYKFFLFGSWMNILLVFVPLSAIAHNLNWDASLRFSFSFVAIMPLAAVSTYSLTADYPVTSLIWLVSTTVIRFCYRPAFLEAGISAIRAFERVVWECSRNYRRTCCAVARSVRILFSAVQFSYNTATFRPT